MIRSAFLGVCIALLVAGCGDSNTSQQDVCDTCSEGTTCNASASQPCACPVGFAGDGTSDGTGCTNINECAAGSNPCDASAKCTDTQGSYTCACNAGYVGDGTKTGTGCTNTNECTANTDNCVDATATCTDTPGSFTCACNAGYQGDGTTTGTSCTNIDECTTNADNCVDTTASCTDTPGSFTCACNAGYQGDGTTTGTGCTNIDECAANTDDCVALATCNDTPGSFTCTCNAGYQGDGQTSGNGCTDIDECATNTDDCDAYARCDNTVGGFECRGFYATSPFQNFAWRLDPTTWEALLTIAPTLPGSTVTGTTGFATDPTTNTVYAISKVSGTSGRVLTTVDTQTMTYTQVGNLGDNFASLTFDSSGQLFGVTGNGASVPETMYTIDKTNATKTLATALGNGADGEVIVFNPTDNFIYHWSGNGTVIFEKFPATAPYTPVTNIPITGTTGGETFGAWFDPAASDFIVFNISSSAVRASPTGTYTSLMASFPDDLRSPAYGLTQPQRVVPAAGSVVGGYTVQLHSHGFSQLAGVPAVTFNGVAATNVTIDSDTQLTVTVPAGSPGPVTVKATDGASRTYSWPAGFTYTTPFAAAAIGPDAGVDGAHIGLAKGGCAIGGGSAGAWAMLGLLVPFVRRRRRAGSAARG